ncbi:DUF4126 family protein [Sphingomonas ginkgonis]|uniref:DUF4126 family protein n=1 Tax=Sphingomonas ginkgonis TaxID=2315330 RepID=A0A3R9YLH1_9SPHN|nr:DUF4126 family protein [Sphingomonas ginkgonis]RST30475.1 DUF4126 family protein [Sphingomonas ginkgonis]
MLASALVGATAGARSMTPLAAVSLASAAGRLPEQEGRMKWLANPWVAAGTAALALGELYGDKMKSAPDRIVPAGLAARLATGAIAGASLARPEEKRTGAWAGATAAVLASFPTWLARKQTMVKHGQTKTGLIEDALIVGAAALVVGLGARALSR